MSSGDQPNSQADMPTDPAPDADSTNVSNSQADDAAAAPQAPDTAPTPEQTAAAPSAQTPAAQTPAAPVRSSVARGSGPLAARGLGVAKPASPTVSPAEVTEQVVKQELDKKKPAKKKKSKPFVAGDKPTPPQARPTQKVAVPNLRADLPDDIQAELEAELAGADVDAILSGAAGMPDRKEPLEEGARVHGQVLKIHGDSVFISLGGPDQGAVPFEQFTAAEPAVGESVEVLVRGFNSQDGLYVLSLPGQAVEVSDWSDLDEGAVIEVMVTGHNSGGLECKAGGVKGFIPISQVTEYRVEDLSEFVDQKLVCLVTEANVQRGNLILSRRAILEREREEKRKEQLETIEAGMTMEGIVRSVKDFGAFVDLGGVDGLIHISKLSWERVKHPSEVIEVGQKVKVRIDSIDKESGKISLTYRDLLVNPWDTAEQEFAIGSVHKGTVTRVADFGCFVRLVAGVEGLVHISELAHHRVSRVNTFVNEGQEVEVKVLSFDREAQKIGLSMKAAQQAPETESTSAAAEPDEPAREMAVKASHSGPLKGGNDRDAGGERFGLRW